MFKHTNFILFFLLVIILNLAFFSCQQPQLSSVDKTDGSDVLKDLVIPKIVKSYGDTTTILASQPIQSGWVVYDKDVTLMNGEWVLIYYIKCLNGATYGATASVLAEEYDNYNIPGWVAYYKHVGLVDGNWELIYHIKYLNGAAYGAIETVLADVYDKYPLSGWVEYNKDTKLIDGDWVLVYDIKCLISPATIGTITASPQIVYVPQGGLGTTNLNWHSNSPDAKVYVSNNVNPSEVLFSEMGYNGSAVAPWIQPGWYYDFKLYDCPNGVKGALLASTRVTGVLAFGTITASPQTVPAPQGGVGTSTLTWNSNVSYVQIHVSCDGQQEVLFYGIIGNSASATATWIVAGHYYDFNLYDWSTGVKGTKLASIRVTGVPASGTISASPQTVSVPQGGLVSSTLTWNSNASAIQVYVSCNGGPEVLFGQTGSNGSGIAPWIQVGYYDFNLYDWSTGVKGTKLSTIRVTGIPISGTISASPQTVSVPQGGLVSSTLTWNSNASAVQVYVSCNGGPEDLFGQTGSNGSAIAPWIQVGYYDFNLYDYSTGVKGTKLATIRVTGIS